MGGCGAGSSPQEDVRRSVGSGGCVSAVILLVGIDLKVYVLSMKVGRFCRMNRRKGERTYTAALGPSSVQKTFIAYLARTGFIRVHLFYPTRHVHRGSLLHRSTLLPSLLPIANSATRSEVFVILLFLRIVHEAVRLF